MKKRYQIEIGYDEATGVYAANVVSVADSKGFSAESASLKLLLADVSKKVRKHATNAVKFPLPEPKRIVSFEQANGAPLIVVPNGMNGR